MNCKTEVLNRCPSFKRAVEATEAREDTLRYLLEVLGPAFPPVRRWLDDVLGAWITFEGDDGDDVFLG